MFRCGGGWVEVSSLVEEEGVAQHEKHADCIVVSVIS